MLIIPEDFETKPIELRPNHPPEPVGVALNWKNKWQYFAWGHKGGGNNCTKTQAKKILTEVHKNHIPLFHNGAFDIKVAQNKLDVPFPKNGFHDTLFLAYLHDPREDSLGLKSLAVKYLGWDGKEDTKLKDWILKHTECKNTKADSWGSHIWEAPAEIAGAYAIADIKRTWQLFQFFMPYVEQYGMLEAYNRERLSMPIFEEMSETGICVNVNGLKRDLDAWKKEQSQRALSICRRLKIKTSDSEEAAKIIGSTKQLADAMDKAGKITDWIYTDKGNRSTSKENLKKACDDMKLVKELELYGILQTYISTFAEPWLNTALETGTGRVFPNFNQVRTPEENGRRSYGTRTGRPSSDHPNFLNVPRNQEEIESKKLPCMRNYLIPDKDGVFLIRDYSQQEVRILAHYEEGVLYRSYMDNPNLDVHDMAGGLIKEAVNIEYPRKHIKIVNFGVIYGMGAKGTAQKIEGSIEEARQLLNAHSKALPSVRELSREISKHTKDGNPIYTWGGRQYFAEPPRTINGIKRDFYYKMLNYLIQGSAADCTKEAMIRADKALKQLGGRLVLQVYDELVAWVPKRYEREGMAALKEAMESVEFDVPMLSDGKIGRKSWGQAVKSKV